MYDPQTVAHEIRYPWGHRTPLLTIWHVDPEDERGMVVKRRDDTCGWFVPPYTPEARERICKLGAEQYRTIFEKQWAEQERRDYASVCYVPSTYDAIYWAWRAIKHQERGRGVWQYDPALSRSEMDEIYSLDANPVDNLRLCVTGVKDSETCADFFITVYHCYLRYRRPWYKHPRWHFWHWKFQIHPWQRFRRWALTRCAGCGGRFRYGENPVSHGWDSLPTPWFGGEIGLYHSNCSAAHSLPGAPVGVASARAEDCGVEERLPSSLDSL